MMPAVFQGVKYNQRKSNLSLRLQSQKCRPMDQKLNKTVVLLSMIVQICQILYSSLHTTVQLMQLKN